MVDDDKKGGVLLEEITGENPALGGEMLTMLEFEAAITCACPDKPTIAPHCAVCHRHNWLDCPVRGQRTVRDVVKEFIETGKIPSVRVVRRHIRQKRRQARAAARSETKIFKAEPKGRLYKKWSIIAGLIVVGGILLYEGGKLVLKLLDEKKERKSG